ncbi:RluA family pseudouridine synthase [Aminithiophilus ramosus]|uniref:Pseudouridine synthase n=2 Tax=Synergistales TaxID=649776 RepID=A0A9Q7AQR6_9BACT|nr:RluA family pseudouridine synthase [Aminithiophilus ramosus]QTX33463.1 RluA family pseudouridine synthase [Aminithiophilus ramosus]QVL36785.1 RluA family pseudouridine synthase [Synergistota bacterium]
MSHQFQVSPHDEGRRADRIVRALYPDLPLGGLMRAFRKGLIRVDGKKASCSDHLSGGQIVDVPFEVPTRAERPAGARGGEASLPLIFGDDNILVVDKPWGLLTQPAARGDDSVASRLLALSVAGEGFFRPTPVHRLDRNTSGTLLVALNGPALRELHQAWRDRAVLKVYVAVVVGDIPLHGEIELPLLKKTGNRVVVSEEGQESLTRFRRLDGDGDLSLVEVELVTGRPHQARVHLAAQGFPVLGDVKYGSEEANRLWRRRGLDRPLLHARSLTFREMEAPLAYLTGRTFRAPFPEDMAEVIRLRGWRNYL